MQLRHALVAATRAPPAMLTGLRAARRIAAARATRSAEGSSGPGTFTRSGTRESGTGAYVYDADWRREHSA